MFVSQICDLQWPINDEAVNWFCHAEVATCVNNVNNNLLGRLKVTLTVLTLKVNTWFYYQTFVKHRPDITKGLGTFHYYTKFKHKH